MNDAHCGIHLCNWQQKKDLLSLRDASMFRKYCEWLRDCVVICLSDRVRVKLRDEEAEPHQNLINE